MPFIPDPVDIEEYRKGCEEDRVFELGHLRQRHSPSSIEQAIQKVQRCAGSVVIYWKEFPASNTLKNAGSCHILCSTKNLRNQMKQRLDGLKRNRRCDKHTRVNAVRRPMTKFSRIARLKLISAHTEVSVNPEARLQQESTTSLAALVERINPLAVRVASAQQENEDFARWVSRRDHSAADLGYNNATLLRDVHGLIQDVKRTVDSINQSPSSTNEPELVEDLTWDDILSETEEEESSGVKASK
ncbi:hypothetical protein F5Y08DRAFT_282949 [Xylaria arbuscula]|nr:hypothetical protein F5Y08DRAFT_282949 [Xylaria arbuscula]